MPVSAKEILGIDIPEEKAKRFLCAIAKARREIENDVLPKGKALDEGSTDNEE